MKMHDKNKITDKSLKRFYKRFYKALRRLDKREEKTSINYDPAIDAFARVAPENLDLITALVRIRGDYIRTGKECAAFLAAL